MVSRCLVDLYDTDEPMDVLRSRIDRSKRRRKRPQCSLELAREAGAPWPGQANDPSVRKTMQPFWRRGNDKDILGLFIRIITQYILVYGCFDGTEPCFVHACRLQIYSVSRGFIDMGAKKKDTNTSHEIREKKIKKKKSLGVQVGVSQESDLSGKRSNAPKARDEIDDLFSDLKKSSKQKEKQKIEKEKVPTSAIVTVVKVTRCF